MNYSHRVGVFSQLGYRLSQVSTDMPHLQEAYLFNNWFTIDMQMRAIQAWANLLEENKLVEWLKPYQFPELSEPKTIAIIMAGNIPLVGFHDLLSVLISGNIALVKVSSDDSVLMKWVISQIIEIEPQMTQFIRFAEDYQLKNFDAVIATGSNNSNRYFEYYFRNKPNLLRKNRKSLAILSGKESDEELSLLADDVFLYFGMGCRNV